MTPVSQEQLNREMDGMNIPDITSATIRQILALANRLENHLGQPFVHLEMGNPGLPASDIGIEAEREALLRGIANQYPNIAGIKPLKENGSKFLKAFLDIDIPDRCIVPTVGSMQGTFTLFILLSQRIPGKDTVLFLDPGFPAQHHQAKLLGLKQESLDVYDCRGEALEARLEQALSKGNITAILYSNPNNPAWFNFTSVEHEIIGRMADKYDAIVLEDHAYLGMDFRQRYGVPYTAPFVPTVAKYTKNCILLVSASKIFSYAGQRIAMVCMTPEVYDRKYEALSSFYDMPAFGDAYIFGVLYCASSGVAHSAQYGFAEMLKASVEGRLDFVEVSKDYGRRAAIAKKLFTDNGFYIVYDRDGDQPISDGFFFTVGYPGFTGAELQKTLLRYGVSTISLPSTGSKQEGLRVCVSMLTTPETVNALEERLAAFHRDFPIK
ncbi:pyridoxal phosphate-dependent aminotransferase [uncultured Alistipes sp.]|uniref:pyridoxal phosphate-dependent aminotransferase n=1 Tax=uncultured Alistipes sp. TaxID=538949 RepID=UPI001A1E2BEB|nr:pyridoxal phosphate-dependent aminotransferase [uncultured Alistipes sp.]MBJ2188169.1 pyridoxal phosphate-dependent aminotransferase [Muribaculaceae bacterium]MCI9054858.1 pyridoxal phosphate-dependent aminotransferase [Muribaculaceae bacterium]